MTIEKMNALLCWLKNEIIRNKNIYFVPNCDDANKSVKENVRYDAVAYFNINLLKFTRDEYESNSINLNLGKSNNLSSCASQIFLAYAKAIVTNGYFDSNTIKLSVLRHLVDYGEDKNVFFEQHLNSFNLLKLFNIDQAEYKYVDQDVIRYLRDMMRTILDI